jgi:hypothetical protein
LKATLELINQMQADGVIGKYAIGGAVGATFYLPPSATVDVDIFATIPSQAEPLLNLSPIYEYLKARGCREEDEYIVVGDWPVQFLRQAMSWIGRQSRNRCPLKSKELEPGS